MYELMKYIDSHIGKSIEDLRVLCEQPSVSAQNKGINECVEVLKNLMAEIGITEKIIPVKNGNPIVFGELQNKKAKGTLGFYNHYDVQPPEPLELWESPPFKVDVREEKVFARGVSDNKGNIIARLEAVRAFIEVFGEVPVNLKFFFEGEEEIGSLHLPSFVKENMNLLNADGYIWEGDGVDEKDRPIINLGYKGIIYVELRAKGAQRDVHSSRAPIVPNPAWRLVWALASLKGSDERIRIPDWYKEVIPPAEEDMRLLKEAPFEEEEEKKELGLKEFLFGLSGIESRKALLFNPSCNICGFKAGYTGSGSKTITPSEAIVKVDFRLVEAQKPDILLKRLKEHLKREGFSDIEIIDYGSYEPARTPLNNPFVIKIVETTKKVYGTEPVIWPTSAGTSPTYVIRKWMRTPVASGGGVAYAGSNIHAPNENIRIKDFVKSIKFIATLISSYKAPK